MTAISSSSANSNAVATLDTPFANDPPTLADIELLRVKMNGADHRAAAVGRASVWRYAGNPLHAVPPPEETADGIVRVTGETRHANDSFTPLATRK
jgi:hypothetical protein